MAVNESLHAAEAAKNDEFYHPLLCFGDRAGEILPE